MLLGTLWARLQSHEAMVRKGQLQIDYMMFQLQTMGCPLQPDPGGGDTRAMAQLRGREGAQAQNLGFRDGDELVSGDLRRVRKAGGHGQ